MASTKLVFSGPKTIYQQVLQPPRHTVAPWAAAEAVPAGIGSLAGPGSLTLDVGSKVSTAAPGAAPAQQRLEQTRSPLAAALPAAEKATVQEVAR